MNQPQLDPLVQYETQIKEIFTYDRLPAILAVLNKFRPPYGEWVKESNFKTIVHVAKIEAMDELQKKLTQFVLNKSKLPEVVTKSQ